MDKLTFTFPDIHGNLHTTDGTGNNAYNADCMEFLKSCPDKFFDLAIVDPPYGDGQQLSRERERERESRTIGSAVGSIGTKQPLRFRGGGRWNKYLPQSDSVSALPKKS